MGHLAPVDGGGGAMGKSIHALNKVAIAMGVSTTELDTRTLPLDVIMHDFQVKRAGDWRGDPTEPTDLTTGPTDPTVATSSSPVKLLLSYYVLT